MKSRITIVLIFCVLTTLSDTAFSQSGCPDSIAYKTNTMGDGKDYLPFDNIFQISQDSIIVYPPQQKTKSNYRFLEFKIESKKCAWNKNFSEGKSDYNLIMLKDGKEVHSTLTVLIKEGNGQIILSYGEGKEPRVFNMVL